MKKVFLIALGVLGLSACDSTKEVLGLDSKPPDEFAVVKRAPLEMPPDYYLRPPRPGKQRPQELQTDEQAKQTVFGDDAVMQETEEGRQRPLTQGEAILLQKTNAINADSDIRSKVDEETARIAKEEQPTIDKLRGLVGKKVDAPATVVDPVKETERLKDNAVQGKPLNEGDTPTLER